MKKHKHKWILVDTVYGDKWWCKICGTKRERVMKYRRLGCGCREGCFVLVYRKPKGE